MSAPVTDVLTIDDFLKLYPRSSEELELSASRGREPLDWLWHYDLEVAAADLWPQVTDTSRLNRAIGYPEMEFTEEGGILYGSIPADGQRWVELPWDWNFPHSVICERRYLKGLISFYRGIMHLEEFYDRGITRVYVYLAWVLRSNRIRGPFQEAFNTKGEDYGRVLRIMEENVRRKKERFTGLSTMPPLPGNARTDEIRERLVADGHTPEMIDRLLQHVLGADEEDLDRIRPRALARRWQYEPREMIRLCLGAVRAGLLTMSWDVLCPHCRGDRERLPSLGSVPLRGHCDVCDIDFDNNTVNSLEITFHAHAAVRDIARRWFCSAEPSTKPHIKIQQSLAPGGRRVLQSMLGPGVYRLRTQGREGYRLLELSSEAKAFDVDWDAADNTPYLEAVPSPRLVLKNNSDKNIAFILEEPTWDRDATRPADLFNLADFRDQFADEALPADLHLEVGEQTIVFTDIVNSTGFYDVQGDARAFARIRDHFRVIFTAADEHGGAVVKTIGDSAMAAFTDPADAVRAALAMREGFPPGGDIRLRISMHTGPCIAVHLNTGMDYFGRTVNLAAKLQGMVGAGQIVATEAVRGAPGVAELLRNYKLKEARYAPAAPNPALPVITLSDDAPAEMAG